MRLQGAIFQLPDALLDAAGVPRSGVKEFLSVMKMEGVWMYGVTDQSLEECRCALEGVGLASYFRGLMQAQEHGTGVDDPQVYYKVVKRLRTAPRATAVFTTDPAVLHAAKEEHLYLVYVGRPGEDEGAAHQVISDYTDMTQST